MRDSWSCSWSAIVVGDGGSGGAKDGCYILTLGSIVRDGAIAGGQMQMGNGFVEA